MALYKQWSVGENGIAAIWKIEEPEAYFYEKTQIIVEIKNDIRRIEHLASRFLLQYLVPNFPLDEIYRDEHNKPIIPNNIYHFSISHSFPYIAVIINPFEKVGIDIQVWNKNIEKIKHKFLSSAEQILIGDCPKTLTAAWCAKEAVYKWHGKKGVEFIEQLPIVAFVNVEHPNVVIKLNLNKIGEKAFLKSLIELDFACIYLEKVIKDDF